MPAQKVQFQDLGIMDYQSAWDYQEELLARNVEIKSWKWRNEPDESVATETTDERRETAIGSWQRAKGNEPFSFVVCRLSFLPPPP